jgi:hypothetical protein
MEITLASIIAACNLVGIILVSIFNHCYHIKLTKNDLFHLSADVKAIAEKQSSIEKSVSELSSSVSYVKGQIDMSLVTIKRKNLKKTKV